MGVHIYHRPPTGKLDKLNNENSENYPPGSLGEEVETNGSIKMDADIVSEELTQGDTGVLVNPILESQQKIDNCDGARKDFNDVGDAEDVQLGPTKVSAPYISDDFGRNNRLSTARPPSARPAPPRPRSSIFRDTEESNYRYLPNKFIISESYVNILPFTDHPLVKLRMSSLTIWMLMRMKILSSVRPPWDLGLDWVALMKLR